MILPVLFAVVGAFIFLALVARRNEAVTRGLWEEALSGECASLDAVRAQILQEREMADVSYRAADLARASNDPDEAARLLRVGARVVESCADTLPQLLRSMSTLARQAAAIAPVDPLRAERFKLTRLRGLARAQAVVHAFLVTSRERLAFRLRVLRFAVPAATRWLVAAHYRTAAAPTSPKEWLQLSDVRGDMGALTQESLETLRVVLRSLAGSRLAARAPAEIGR